MEEVKIKYKNGKKRERKWEWETNRFEGRKREERKEN